MKKLLSTIVLSCLSLTAYSASTVTKFVMVSPLGKTQLYTPRDQGVILANLQNVSKSISGGALNLPVELPVLVPRNFDNAFFDPMSFMLVSPYQIKINGAAKNPVFSRVIEMHEYGHSVLDQNLDIIFKHDPVRLGILRDFKKFAAAIRNDMRLATQADLELKLLLPDINQDHPDMTDPKVHDALKDVEIIKAQNAKLESIFKSNERLLEAGVAIMQSFTAYNEFFADVLAVIVTGNPQAIADALTLTKNDLNFSDRGFRVRVSRRAHNPEAHNFLTLSREFIFKYYLSDPEIRSKGKTWIMVKTLESISCALKSQKSDVEILEREFQRLRPRVSKERFFLEGLNAAFNNCIEAKFEGR